MTKSVRAVRASVKIGSLTVDGFMLPDGSYRTQPNQSRRSSGLIPTQRVRFKTLKRPKKLVGWSLDRYGVWARRNSNRVWAW